MVQEFKESILRLSELKLMPKSQVREILIDLTIMIHGSNKSENQKEKTNSTLNSQPHPRHSTPKG